MTLRIETAYVAGSVRVPTNAEQAKFARAVDQSLAQIRATDVGSSLLDDIARAGRELVIVKAALVEGNKCRQPDSSTGGCKAACYQEVLETKALWNKIQELLDTRRITDQNPAVKKFLKFFVPQASGGDREAYVQKVRSKPVPFAHKETGQKGLELQAGSTQVCSLQRGLIGYHVMDYLTPGAGTPAMVLWDPDSVQMCEDLPVQQRAVWMTRPPWIALAHEMIHGWRLVTGRCVFQPKGIEDYWEEAMTVGLPPYDRCRFTENRLRHVKAFPLRTYYGESTVNRSTRAALKHGDVSARSQISFSIKVSGSGPDDPLVFDYELRPVDDPDKIVRGKTDPRGRATAIAQWMTDGEIRFKGFGAFGRVETQWQKVLLDRTMILQFGRYSFICERFR
ncbi:M91 family zinc metallopeptidase [Paraburkholderia sp. C35]|uniref:M91 family zinc metallopeptidase n=1 Tax=Paraburkholderia sp. C35 TaxID=2126993 RepID=UPI000D694547|nr:M91 family zinc metallopeptidase [Paraburkholderia sp. C35]